MRIPSYRKLCLSCLFLIPLLIFWISTFRIQTERVNKSRRDSEDDMVVFEGAEGGMLIDDEQEKKMLKEMMNDIGEQQGPTDMKNRAQVVQEEVEKIFMDMEQETAYNKKIMEEVRRMVEDQKEGSQEKNWPEAVTKAEDRPSEGANQEEAEEEDYDKLQEEEEGYDDDDDSLEDINARESKKLRDDKNEYNDDLNREYGTQQMELTDATRIKVRDVRYLEIEKANIMAGIGVSSNQSIALDYDGRYEKPTAELLQEFTDHPDSDEQLDHFSLESPIEFLPNYKNPCWFEPVDTTKSMYQYNYYTWLDEHKVHTQLFKRDFTMMVKLLKERAQSSGSDITWRIRCLPYFYIIGMPRCGSTDLSYSLNHHPHVIVSRLKEFKYWNRARLEHPARTLMVVKQPWYKAMMEGQIPMEEGAVNLKNYPHPLRHYVEAFDYMSELSRNITLGTTPDGVPFHPLIMADQSPSYMFDFDAWDKLAVHEGLDEPTFTVAHYIKQLTPKAKFIITLRNPVDRLYSDYKAFYTSQPKSAENFDLLVRKNLAMFQECQKKKSLRACLYSHNSTIPIQPVRPRVGLYYLYLKDWFAVYPREQFYITRVEDFANQKAKVASEIFDFLELPPVSDRISRIIDEERAHNTAIRINRKQSTVARTEMLNSTKELLENFYRPWNKMLAKYLGDDRYLFE